MRKLFVIVFCLLAIVSNAQQTFEYAEKDGQKLYLDVYKSANPDTTRPLFVYVFGGGFISGVRNDSKFLPFINALNDKGYNVVSIDYRLGLKNNGNPGIFNIKPLENAIAMAAEDLLSATRFLIDNESKTGVSAKNIVTCGSSAGAITVLQADYEISNKFEMSKIVPEGFRYGGVIAFSGAIFSKNGRVKYRKSAPAPTMMVHGTDDNVVPYKQIHLFRLCLCGSCKLAERFEKFQYPYYIYRYKGHQHEVNFYVYQNLDDICKFIQDYVVDKKPLKCDFLRYNPDEKPTSKYKSHNDLYKDN